MFAKLGSAGGELISPDLLCQKRAIRTDDVEKDWLKSLTFRHSNHLLLDSTSRFALGEFGGNLYLIAVGVEVVEPPAELQHVTLNAGMFTAIAYELDVPMIRTADIAERLFEYVFYPVENEYELIDYGVVMPFFQKIDLYLVDPASAIALDSEFGLRAAIAAILGAPETRPLVWPRTALERFSFMVRDPNERAPFHLLLRALTEARDDAAFLALYRCVEQLFPIPAIGDLSAELGLSRPTLGVAAAIEKHLGWRRREEVAIAQLFAELDQPLIDRMLAVVGAVVPTESQSRSVSKRVYDLRNQCVHFRPAHSVDAPLTTVNWSTLSDLMLEAIQCLYAKYSAAFNEPEEGTVLRNPIGDSSGL